MSPYRRLNIFAIIALVLLRLGVGWHFFMEGAVKVRDGKFSSAGFLGGAKGPLADSYHSMITDYDGWIRLDAKKMNASFDAFASDLKTHYGLTDDQIKLVDKEVKRSKEALEGIYEQWAKDINDYKKGLNRVSALNRDAKYEEIASLRSQRDEIETKWRALPKPALSAIDAVTVQLEKSLNAVATPEQSASVKPLSYSLPDSGPMSTKFVDKAIPIFDMVIGILLVIGLLTPIAALVAAGFLISVVLSQFPGYPGTQPTYFQAVEALACLVLAGTDAGRFAGLDYLSWSWWQVRKAGGFEYE